jgi:hypothetical protein
MKSQVRFDQHINVDAAESVMLNRSLEDIAAQTYDVKYPELEARNHLPVNNRVSPAAQFYVYRQYDRVGMAKIIANYASDLPRADVVRKEFYVPIKSIGDAYGYNIQELRGAAKEGIPLDMKKGEAAFRAVEERFDKIARTGDTEHGLTGFLNLANATSYTVANGAAGSAKFEDKTPDEILRDLNGIVNNIVTTTKNVERPDTLLLPLKQYTLIASKRLGDGSDETILSHFLKTNPYIKTVAPWYELAAAGAGGTDRMVCYKKDPKNIELIIPQEFEQFPPQMKNLEVVIPCHARCGGVVAYYPLSVSYGDGI